MKFKVTLVCPTVIRATIHFEADSPQDANAVAIDELLAKVDEHAKALARYHNRGANIGMPYPTNPVEWDTDDVLENADLGSLEVDEVEDSQEKSSK